MVLMDDKIYEGWLLLMLAYKFDEINGYDDAVRYAKTGKFGVHKDDRERVMAEAEELYKSGMKMSEVANELGISAPKVQYWKKINWKSRR